MTAFLLALLVLIVAAAKPQRTVAVPVERAAIMLATDVSGSMEATDVKPSRLVAARRAARNFVDGVAARRQHRRHGVQRRPRVLQSPTPERADIDAALNRLTPSGGTATGDAITAALRVPAPAHGHQQEDRRRAPSCCCPTAPRRRARTRSPPRRRPSGRRSRSTRSRSAPPAARSRSRAPAARADRDAARPARPRRLAPGSRARRAARPSPPTTPSELKRVYQRLGSQLGTEKRKRQLTSSFAGGALVLLLVGAGMSLAWFGRLV
jgi:Ca-activated chloride channel family protein